MFTSEIAALFRKRFAGSMRMALLFTALISLQTAAGSNDSLQWSVQTIVNAGSGDFAPTYISSNRFGTLTQAASAYENASLQMTPDPKRRFSLGFGLQVWAGIGSTVKYDRYNMATAAIESNEQHPAYVWLQELYGELHYRSFFLEVGMRDYNRSLFSNSTSSGDIVLGQNARGIPQLRLGFNDFVNVPLTRNWLQIQGEIAYGKFMDDHWLENHYNRYNYYVTTGLWFHYKRLYFRSNPSKPFSATIGIQHAAQFGGTQNSYIKGEKAGYISAHIGIRDFWDVLIPRRNGSGTSEGDKLYYNGNHLGSWDLRLRYRLPQGTELTFYVQSPWEDGSGIGKLNGWDGVWGLEYKAASRQGWLTDATLEYIDFTNQSGPMHWAPGNYPDTNIPNEATGADDYYNNFFFNGWCNNGIGIGSPLAKSPIYNTDGYLNFTDNRIRGFHLGLQGNPTPEWQWRLLTGYIRSYGTPYIPRLRKTENYALMLEAGYSFKKIPGLKAAAQAALDAGNLYGHRYGVALSISYSGAFSIKKQKK